MYEHPNHGISQTVLAKTLKLNQGKAANLVIGRIAVKVADFLKINKKALIKKDGWIGSILWKYPNTNDGWVMKENFIKAFKKYLARGTRDFLKKQNGKKFTWIPFFEELFNNSIKVANNKNIQKKLQKRFGDLTIATHPAYMFGQLMHWQVHDEKARTEERILESIEVAQYLKELFKIQAAVPIDFVAVYGGNTFLDDIDKKSVNVLYNLIFNNEDISTAFNNILTKGKRKTIIPLTQLLYLCRPTKYFPLSGRLQKTLLAGGLMCEGISSFEQYSDLLDELKRKYTGEFYEIVYALSNTDLFTNIKHSNNLILYGPPATGKTYITKEMAINILEE